MCNDVCLTFLLPSSLRGHIILLTHESVMMDIHLWDLEVLFWGFGIDYIIDLEVELNLQLLFAPGEHAHTHYSQPSASKSTTVFFLG